MDQTIPKEITQKIIHSCQEKLRIPHYRVFYFGSRASGLGGKRSDIDIGIEASQPIPAKIFFEIQTDLETFPLLQKIDLVDFQTVSEPFKNVALQNINLIHEQ